MTMHANDHHEHDEHGHGHDEDGPLAHVTRRGYMIGFVLAIVLTAIPFWLVGGRVLSSTTTTVIVLLAFAIVQIVVHLVYFLHMDFRSESGWNMLSLIFTLILVVITLCGSIWVMYHLDTNMMPMSPQDMRIRP